MEDRRRRVDLADVVDERGRPDLGNLGRPEPHRACDAFAMPCDAAAVPVGVGVPDLEQVAEAFQQLHAHGVVLPYGRPVGGARALQAALRRQAPHEAPQHQIAEDERPRPVDPPPDPRLGGGDAQGQRHRTDDGEKVAGQAVHRNDPVRQQCRQHRDAQRRQHRQRQEPQEPRADLVPRGPGRGCDFASPRPRRAPGTGSTVPRVPLRRPAARRPPDTLPTLASQEGLRRDRHGPPMLRTERGEKRDAGRLF